MPHAMRVAVSVHVSNPSAGAHLMSDRTEVTPNAQTTERLELVLQAPEIDTPRLKHIAKMCGANHIQALPRINHDAFRLSPALRSDDLAPFCADAEIDFGYVPVEQRLDRVRLVAMDMDSTLITIECIDEIADTLGIKTEVAAITEAAMRGEVNFRESLTRRVALLAGVDVSTLEQVYAERLRLSPGAARMLAVFKTVNAKTLLVSGGFTFFTDRLKKRLDLDYAVANTLEILYGSLTGRIFGDIVDADVKAATVRKLRDTLTDDDGLVVGIGDGANDLPMFAQADISIAYHAKPIVRSAATYAIDYCGLDAILNLFL
jgi:phosphoserine phosphatase